MQEQVQSNKAEQYHFYSRNALIALIIICAMSTIVFIIALCLSSFSSENNNPALYELTSTVGECVVMVLIVEAICVMMIDRRGALTLRGGMKSQILHKGKMVSTAPGSALLYLLFPYIMMPIYVIRVTSEYHRDKQLRQQHQKYQIASLEAELGILPPTDGECRVCQKPLVIGAEFCQYCSEPVLVQPKVCSVCAATALPDANWCPKCRAALS